MTLKINNQHTLTTKTINNPVYGIAIIAGNDRVLRYQRPEDLGPRICVPAACRRQVSEAAHGGDVLVGHPGVTRTTVEVSRYYYWKSLHKDVAHFVRSCATCATSKASAQQRLGVEGFSAVPVLPFTWVDRTSKMIVAAAVKTGKSSGRDLADLMFTQTCCRFGLLTKITHDNDVRFKHVWRDIWRRLGAKIACTSAYNPQADPAERANRQVLEALRAAVATVVAFDQWDVALPQICFGLNTHVSSGTGTSPFELAHGAKIYAKPETLVQGLSLPHDNVVS